MSVKQSDNDSLTGVSVDGGRYTIVKLIGEGGMGRVFQARQTSMNRMVALKILRKQLVGDGQLLERFQREAMSVSRLRHPNTITIFDYGRTEDGFLFMAMELLGGRSLYQVLRTDGALDLNRALHVIAQVAGAVDEAHAMGIVHRDLKPENIQIDRVANDPDFAKVLDFGIAKIVQGENDSEGEQKTLTLAGAVFGTPHYMSPEQVHGRTIDKRTDIYSLGVILFEMLAGKPPFDGATPMAVMMAQASKSAPELLSVNPDADVTDSVLALISDCLQKEPEHRPASMAEVVDRIRDIQIELGEASSVRMPALVLNGRTSNSGAFGPGRLPAADSGPRVPSFRGEVDAGIEPADTDFNPRGGNRLLVWAVAASLLLGVGGVLAWRYTQTPAPAPDAGVEAEPHRIEFSNTAVFRIDAGGKKALVFENGESIGQTGSPLRLATDQAHTLTVRLAGFQDAKVVFAKGAEQREAKVELVRANDWIQITSSPSKAEVYRGNTLVGQTPFTWKPDLEPLPVELRFSLAGYEDQTRSLALEPAPLEPPEGYEGRPLNIELKAVEAARPAAPATKPSTRRRVRRRPKPTKPHKRPATKPPVAPVTAPPKAPATKPPVAPATKAPAKDPYIKL